MTGEKLQIKSNQLRIKMIEMMTHAGSGHPGGSLSVIDILVALYYGNPIQYDSQNPLFVGRDRVVLSKGHASPALYVILADLGFFAEEKLAEFDAADSMLPKHCNRLKTPGVEASTGALGQGFSMAVGMALAERLDKQNDYSVYCILGDGECQSGEVWEAAMSAAQFQLDSLKVVVDNNKLQIDGDTDEVMSLGDLAAKWAAFGWEVSACDGHDCVLLVQKLLTMNRKNGKPKVLLANTTKGKGVSFMENDADWHSRKITPQERNIAIKELTRSMEITRQSEDMI